MLYLSEIREFTYIVLNGLVIFVMKKPSGFYNIFLKALPFEENLFKSLISFLGE